MPQLRYPIRRTTNAWRRMQSPKGLSRNEHKYHLCRAHRSSIRGHGGRGGWCCVARLSDIGARNCLRSADHGVGNRTHRHWCTETLPVALENCPRAGVITTFTMTNLDQLPTDTSKDADGHAGHQGHNYTMIACCPPMLIIARTSKIEQ